MDTGSFPQMYLPCPISSSFPFPNLLIIASLRATQVNFPFLKLLIQAQEPWLSHPSLTSLHLPFESAWFWAFSRSSCTLQWLSVLTSECTASGPDLMVGRDVGVHHTPACAFVLVHETSPGSSTGAVGLLQPGWYTSPAV